MIIGHANRNDKISSLIEFYIDNNIRAGLVQDCVPYIFQRLSSRL